MGLCANYLAAMQHQRKPKTWASMNVHVRAYILPYFGHDHLARKLCAEDVRGFIREAMSNAFRPPRSRRTRPPMAATINRVLVTLRCVLAFGEQTGVLSTNVAAGVKTLPEQNTQRHRALTDVEVSAWLPGMLPATSRWVRFALATGLRRDEMWHLRWMDVDPDRRLLSVAVRDGWSPKGGAGRFVPLLSDALDVVEELGGAGVGLVFGPANRRRNMNTAWRRTRLPGRSPTPHDLRHTCASRAAARGATLTDLMAWFAWEDPSTAARYLHAYDGRLAELAERMERA